MRIFPSKAKGSMVAPPSKSMAHRHLICAALATGKSIIYNIDLSQDIKATLACIGQLGAKAVVNGTTIEVEGVGAKTASDTKRVFFCNESGSTLRFFIPLAMLSASRARFEGSEVLMSRPLSVYEDICNAQGICLEHVNGGVELEGKLEPQTFEIPGNISSQFITGLLFALPLLDSDSTIVLTQSVESRPYIDMTLQVQREFGIDAHWVSENTLSIPGNQSYKAKDTTVEGDYSNAAFFEALNTLGGCVDVTGLRADSLQGDKIYQSMFRELEQGCPTLDISDCPDLGPILFVVAATHNGGVFTGTRRLKIKESNRGEVMCTELAKFGIQTKQEENRIEICGGVPSYPTQVVLGHNDHRIVMSMATLMTVTGGQLSGIGAVRKSLPDYFDRIARLGIVFEREGDE